MKYVSIFIFNSRYARFRMLAPDYPIGTFLYDNMIKAELQTEDGFMTVLPDFTWPYYALRAAPKGPGEVWQ